MESRLRLYRRTTVVLAVICAFLVVVLAGQMGRGTSPAAVPASGGSSASQAPGQPGASSSPTTGTGEDSGAGAAYADAPVVTRDPADPMAVGSVDAPVVLVEWTDLRCPFCAAFARDTLPALLSEYVDSGLVRLEVRDVAFFGDQSEDAAVAARAAGEQGLAMEYMETVYTAAPSSGHPDLPRETLIGFAEQAGVPDIARFTADLDSADLRAAARTSTATAQGLGVNSVPFFVVGDQALAGAQPIDVFRQYLDQALKGAGVDASAAGSGAAGAGREGAAARPGGATVSGAAQIG
jgi:protein-disulfide isomerase